MKTPKYKFLIALMLGLFLSISASIAEAGFGFGIYLGAPYYDDYYYAPATYYSGPVYSYYSGCRYYRGYYDDFGYWHRGYRSCW